MGDNKEIKLSYFQRTWLNTHGGRDEFDVMRDEEGIYVLMGNGRGGEKRVYIPDMLKEK
jgi:hypothetical protein